MRKKAYEDIKLEKQHRVEVASGNPLLQNLAESSGRRKWDEDTVFTNQAVKVKGGQRGFVNDVVRSEFHRKFLNKYII
jgi:protein CWC15